MPQTTTILTPLRSTAHVVHVREREFQRDGQREKAQAAEPWLSVPLMYLGLVFVAIFPIALTVDEATWGVCPVRLRAFWALVIGFWRTAGIG